MSEVSTYFLKNEEKCDQFKLCMEVATMSKWFNGLKEVFTNSILQSVCPSISKLLTISVGVVLVEQPFSQMKMAKTRL